ncbi:hypothetical protein LAZ67_13000961 [Cordylochernes scorpioides]|uniref:Mos1 transposase HTH domain-containing protein n=1 Tax=Cordylochernes scorpioides TaxID=51811 RepID=A0ABY6L479_9ARAC|nr:hypothetical protein LAZ67_13000961 [Cordylochernes scorpioides]
MSSFEQKANIKFCLKLKRPFTETLALMTEAHEDEKLSRTQVYFWYKRFIDGRKSITDDSRSGRPLTSTTDRNIGQVRDLIVFNRKFIMIIYQKYLEFHSPISTISSAYTRFKAGRISIEDDPRQGRPKFQRTDENVQKITDLIKENPRTTLLELEQDTGISTTTIGRIVTEDLKLKKTPAKFIPRFLTNEQKLCRLATCEDMMEMTRTDPEWKDKIITGDETWVYGYHPETKSQSAEWRG